MKIYELDEAIRAICPIDGINSDGVIWFKPEATKDEKAQAEKIMVENLPTLDLNP